MSNHINKYLPLNYPDIVAKFTTDRLEDGTATNENFDKIDFEGVQYTIDITDDKVVRIWDDKGAFLANVTVHDNMYDWAGNPVVGKLLQHIENNTKYSVTDWINFYLKELPVYMGIIVDIYCTGDEYHIQPTTGAGYHIDSEGNVRITGGSNFVLTLLDEYTVTATCDSLPPNEVGDIINAADDAEQSLLHLLHAEYVLRAVNSPESLTSSVVPIDPLILSAPKFYNLFGLRIEVTDSKRVLFNHNKRDYVIDEAGEWYSNAEPVKKKDNSEYLIVGTYFKIPDAGEYRTIKVVKSILNSVAKLMEDHSKETRKDA